MQLIYCATQNTKRFIVKKWSSFDKFSNPAHARFILSTSLMKKLLLLPFLALAAHSSFGQQFVKYEGEVKTPICYARPEDVHTKVSAPQDFLARRRSNRPAANRSTIIVTYNGFTPEAQAAFQYAVDIWQTQLISPVPITIDATWRELASGVLGSAGANGYYNLNDNGERISNSLYPVALVEKIVGINVNGTSPDIVANFGSTFNWYLGTDGNVPTGQYDLVSVVLHELGHGLGFATPRGYTPATGIGTLTTPPSIYADFIENGAGQRIADTRLFGNPSVELGRQFVSNDLYFNSPLARAVNNDQRPRLYAPTVFAAGSSTSHLDEDTYAPGDPNSLMSPQFAASEAIHSPGPIMIGMFNDMGWFNTSVENLTIYPDTETPRTFPIVAEVVSDGTITAGSVKLNYSFNNGPLVTLAMTTTTTANRYTATIPNPGSGVRVSYYIEASDNETRRIYTAPGRDPFATESNRYSFFVGADVVAPVIVHSPIPYFLTDQFPYTISATVTDNIRVASVTLEYSVNGGTINTLALTQTPNTNTYTASLPAPAGIKLNDQIAYRIVAKDASSNANQATAPATGYYTGTVIGPKPVQDSYVNNFNAASSDFVGNGFSVAQPTGFADGAIHSTHFYANNANYVYQLLVPIRVKADATQSTVKFDEIVLVEPGTGNAFPAEFYDYVVVEGSTNGRTWTRLANGYDSRDKQAWLDAFKAGQATANDNSTTVGTPTLFLPRTLNLQPVFKAGDNVQLRFRLVSDGGLVGWGWAIDNLNIQNTSVTATSNALKTAGVTLFPNPSAGQFTLQTRFDKPAQDVQLIVRNAVGQEVLRQSRATVQGQVALPIDLSACANGFYIVSLTANGETVSRKVLLSR